MRALNLRRSLLIFGIPITLLGILIFIIKSPFLAKGDTLSLAITADLLLIVPLVYFLLIRKTEIPKTTVVPVMIIGLVIGSYFMPLERQTYLALFKTWALPLIEISVFTFVIIKVRKTIKTFKNIKGTSPDFYSTLKIACTEILPKKVVLPVATEIAVIYYGFINWKARPIQENEFTHHKNSGTPTLMIAFILIIAVEMVSIHFLLAQWSSIAAWVLTCLSIYSTIQVLGFAKSLGQRPISINQNSVTLKYGVLNEVDIPFLDIETIELSTKELTKDPLTKTLSPLGELESHNLIIHLKKENELIGLYGFKKKFKTLGLHVDEPNSFKEKLEFALQPKL